VATRHFFDAFILHALVKTEDTDSDQGSKKKNQEPIMGGDDLIIWGHPDDLASQSSDDPEEDFQDVLEKMTYLLLKGNFNLKIDLVEGFTKLILGNAINKPEIWFTILYLFWEDKALPSEIKG
jgi:hypothetical protein